MFVPGDRPERFAKAASSGADVVVIDLEDAVPPRHKARALGNTLAWLESGGSAVIRVNAAGTPWHRQEIDELAATGAVLMLPKAEESDVVTELHQRLSGARVIALIETARGLRRAEEVCSAPGVIRAALGTLDLGAEIGVDPAAQGPLAYARSRLVIASAAAGLPPPIDGATAVLGAQDVLVADVERARSLGFGGKLCIHPTQVGCVNAGLGPSESELEWALKVTAAAQADSGVVVVDGSMVDPPVVRRAERILRTVRALSPQSASTGTGC
jgi:citrate lyase subunit beta / citryl-CoA lyase